MRESSEAPKNVMAPSLLERGMAEACCSEPRGFFSWHPKGKAFSAKSHPQK